MHLKSLTLKGFKSFAQSTTFAFEPGVTCVVGPNGSGKSNVVDALAWVMGEQGAKTLRGGKMEDVIFAGTATRGPLGRAEVILTIDNADGALPIEYAEVTITRTLFRNGGSEYQINGQSCRLLDVQELLSDSGLGREMHVIVGQGRLDSVLHASPEERRGFIEEAAGILKHRRRKEKTLRKLEAMQTNLTRLSDLAGEIRRQLKPLGKQAEIAREAQSTAAVVRDAKARLLADDVVALRTALDAHRRSESERHAEQLVLQEQLAEARSRIERLEREGLGDAVDRARATVTALERAEQRLRALSTLAHQRVALLSAEDDAPAAASSTSPAAIDEAAAEVARLRAGIGDAEVEWRSRQELTRRARSRLDALDAEISAQSALVSRHDLESTRLSGQADATSSRRQAVTGEVERRRAALESAGERRRAAQAAFDDAETRAAASDLGENALDEAYEVAQNAVFEAESGIDEVRESVHVLERERDALTARVSALSLSLDTNDGASALVQAAPRGIRGLVAEHVQVDAGFEPAIAAALGTLTDAVLADDHEAAADALVLAGDDDLGRVDVVVAAAETVPRELATVPGVVPAADVVRAPAGVLALLARTVIADDLAAARAAWPRFADDDVTVLTRDGAVLSRYVLRGGSGASRSRLELVADRDAARDRLATVESELDRARFLAAERRGVLTAAKESSQAALTDLRESDAQLAAQSEALNRLRVQVEAAAAESGRARQALAEAEARIQDADAEVARTTEALERHRSAPRPLLDASERGPVAAELEAAREAEVEARLAVETARERVRAEEARLGALRTRLDEERQAAERAARRAVVRGRQRDAAARVVDALPPVLASVDRSVAEARLALAAAESVRAEQTEELSTRRREEAAVRERLQGVSESVHGLELQIYEKKLQLASFVERASNELGLVEDVLVVEYGPDVPVPVPVPEGPDADDRGADDADAAPAGVPFVRVEQQQRLAVAERALAQLGRVNPLALEEFAALEQRHAFLTEQLTDLTNTRADLLTIIDEIDGRMRDIFAAAFEDTRVAFGEVFPILFPGGSGSIRLTDPDDLLVTGIEVSVKPAGKKIERLSLLSGGERSLAAVALLVAIFKARPSPFYILDEVEAALDDANLGRLLQVFEELRASSQLIVITHQKRTMEIADALYGVSMRQDGVSAVVGQRVAAA